VFAADSEGLLPIHYFSQRNDKDEQLDLLQYMLQLNPKGTALPESELMPKMKQSSSKNIFSFLNKSSENSTKKEAAKQSHVPGGGNVKAKRKSVTMNRRASSVQHIPRNK
jgi:hypothetical protein